MNAYRFSQRWAGAQNQAKVVSDAQARFFCYMLGPFSGMLMLYLNRYGTSWSVRFHAFHSILMTGLWAGAWGILRLIEQISPWLLGAMAREIRFAANLGFVLLWVSLLVTAYEGSRCAAIPPLHSLAVKLARKYEKYAGLGRRSPAH